MRLNTRCRMAPVLLALALATPVVARAQVEEPRIPLRTAIAEINTFRSAYQDAYNKKDGATLAAMYEDDAVVVNPDGSTLMGIDAIRKALTTAAPNWNAATITSDTMRVYGHSAWDVGVFTTTGPNGEKITSRYLVTLRRGLTQWKLARVANIPMTGGGM